MILYAKTLFDGNDMVTNGKITIEDGRIVRVEKEVDLEEAKKEDHPIDPFIMPGLIDSCAHLLGYHEGPPEGRPFQPHEFAAESMLYAGITTVRDTGNTIEALKYLAYRMEEKKGLHIFRSGPMLDEIPVDWPYSRPLVAEADVQREIRILSQEKMDFIKVFKNVTPSMLSHIVNHASEYKLKVSIQNGKATAEEAVACGVAVLESAMNLPSPEWVEMKEEPGNSTYERLKLWSNVDIDHPQVDAFIDRLAETGIFVVPEMVACRRKVMLDEAINDPFVDFATPIMPYLRHLKSMRQPFGYMVGKKYLKEHMDFPRLSKSEQSEADEGLEKMKRWLVKCYERGVQLAVGSGAPSFSVIHGFGLLQEMREWVRCGISPRSVLKAATSHASKMLGTEEHGLLTPGAWADLLVLPENPLDRFDVVFSDQKRVMCRGEWVDREGIVETMKKVQEKGE